MLYPLMKEPAGNAAWSNMHHRVSLYSDTPTDKEKERMKIFLYESMQSVAKLCKHCKQHIRDYLKSHPIQPALENRETLSKYLCEFHNSVNKSQNKEVKDCTKILRSKEEAKCNEDNCHHNVVKDTTDLKATFEKFKEISTKVFHSLCDRYKLPYPDIKFHECPSNPLNSCTSFWLDSQTQDIAERPIVYLHPNLFGLRSIVHEFMHYMKQLKKDTLGGLNEEEVERETQQLINHEFPFDEMDDKDKRAPVIAQTQIVRNDYVSRLRNFPTASRIYDKYLVNIKRRDYRHGPGMTEESGDWVFDMLGGVTQGRDEGVEAMEQSGFGAYTAQREQEKSQHIFSFMDGLYSPFAALFGIKAADLNRTNTPMIISNAALAIIKSQMSPIGALLLSSLTSLGIYGALAFSRNGLSYGDKLLMNSFGSNFLWSSIDYVRPDIKQDVIEGAMDLGSAVSAQRWDVVPQILLGDSLSAMLGESTTSQASPQTAQRNLQRASLGGRGISSAGSNTIKSPSAMRNVQRTTQVLDNIPENTRPVVTGARGGNPNADAARGRVTGGSGVNALPMYDPDSVMIPSDEEEVYESSFGMHVADGTSGASTRYDDEPDQRNTVRDIFNQGEVYYDEYEDGYY